MDSADFIPSLGPGLEGCLTISPEGRYLYVNEIAARQRNQTVKAMLGARVADIFPDETVNTLFQRVKEGLVLGELPRERLEVPGPDGDSKWLDLQLESVPEGMLVRSRDITSLVVPGALAESSLPSQTEPDLQTREARLRALFEGISEGFALQEIVLDAHGVPCDSRFLEVNAAFERLTGLSRSQVVGRRASEAAPPAPLWGPRFAPVARTGQSLRMEAPWPPTGQTFDISVSSPSPGLFAVIFMDITSRRNAEEKAQGQAAVLKAINEIFRAAMTLDSEAQLADRCLEVACRLTSSSQGFLANLGADGALSLLALKGDPETGTPDLKLPASGFWRDVLGSGHCLEGPGGYAFPGCQEPVARLLGVPLLRGDRILGCLGLAGKPGNYTAWDRELLDALSGAVVEGLSHKRSEAAVQDLNRRLEARGREMEAALVELDSFSYTVSHDLRAPVRHIIGFAELLQAELSGRLEGKAAHFMETILASSRQMGQLIDALLALSQSGRAVLQRKPLPMGALVQDVLLSLRPDLQGRSVVLEVAPLPVVEADPALLRSVVANLLSNALKFTRHREEARISVTWEDQGPEWAFSVTDNGVGFNPRYVSKLFGVFQRLHAAAQFEGTGVGLANVRRIIQRHGGRVWATGAVDAGATFTFTLPAPGTQALP